MQIRSENGEFNSFAIDREELSESIYHVQSYEKRQPSDYPYLNHCPTSDREPRATPLVGKKYYVKIVGASVYGSFTFFLLT